METAHHARVYYAEDISVLPSELQTPAADIEHYREEKWTIEHSRTLIAAAQLRPVVADTRTFVLQFKTATNEAQNTLLKLLEEPPVTAMFNLVVPQPTVLLETVRSRLHVMTQSAPAAGNDAWQTFVGQSVADRLAAVAELQKQKDNVAMNGLLAAALADTSLPQSLRLLLDTYARTQGASRKMLLEEVALSLAEVASE